MEKLLLAFPFSTTHCHDNLQATWAKYPKMFFQNQQILSLLSIIPWYEWNSAIESSREHRWTCPWCCECFWLHTREFQKEKTKKSVFHKRFLPLILLKWYNSIPHEQQLLQYILTMQFIPKGIAVISRLCFGITCRAFFFSENFSILKVICVQAFEIQSKESCSIYVILICTITFSLASL